MHEFGAFTFLEAGDGDSCPGGDDFGNVFFGDLLGEQAWAGGAFFEGGFGLGQLLLQPWEYAMFDFGGFAQVAAAFGLFEFEFGVFQTGAEFAHGDE